MLPWAYLDGQLQFRKPSLIGSAKAFHRHAKMARSRLSCTGITVAASCLLGVFKLIRRQLDGADGCSNLFPHARLYRFIRSAKLRRKLAGKRHPVPLQLRLKRLRPFLRSHPTSRSSKVTRSDGSKV